MSEVDDSKLVFICGCPRSGTSWAWSLLAGLPNFEPLLIEDFPGLKARNPSLKKMRTKDGFNTTETAVFFSNLSDNDIKKSIAQKQKNNPNAYLVEKTPSNTLILPRAMNLFPNAKFIYLLRDPRATISSIINTRLNSGHVIAKDINEAIELYKKHYNAAAKFRSSSNLHTLKYEDLSADPAGVLGRLVKEIQGGLAPDEQNIEQTVKLNAGKLNQVKINAFRKGQVDSYKRDLKRNDIRTIEKKLGTIMQKEGYRRGMLRRLLAHL